MKIVDILNEEKDLLHKLKDLLAIERDCLIKEDGDLLLKIVYEKQELMEQIGLVEEKRMEAYPHMKLKDFEDMEEIKQDIQNIGMEIKNIVSDIQHDQETNRLLTKQSIVYGQKILSILQNTGHKNPSTYGANGKVGNRKGSVSAKINHSV